jgi:hypothetical protein
MRLTRTMIKKGRWPCYCWRFDKHA